MSDTTSTGLYETPADAGTDDRGAVRLWLDAITLARKTEDPWRKNADKAIERYRDEGEARTKKFNILYANTQILLPSLYNSTPTPDVRRRHGDADPVGKVASQVIERGLAYSTDAYDFDATMRAVVLDMILPGRGVARVRYDATAEGAQSVTCDYVDWRDFIMGPGRQWTEVPWIAFDHRLTREQLAEQFGAIGQTMPMDVVTGDHGKTDPRDVPEVFKRATVYEIWDKQAREVLFLAPAVPDRLLRRVPDPLGLGEFWPTPRPVYDVMDSGSMVPLVPYDLYKHQADELDRVTARINALVAMCRYRGLRAGDLVELTQLADAKDGDFVPVENAQQYLSATGGGGLERAMWTTPIETIAKVIAQLEAHRMAVKDTIYEITGLSDILRGATVASETATAQQIKSQFGSLRIQDRQREVQRFARDLYRLKAEIMAERFEPENLSVMSGIDLPTPEQKAQAQAQAQAQMMAQGAQPGQPMPPQVAQMLETPTWDDVMSVLRSDLMRAYRVDIETDSTIQADVARAQQNAAQFVQGFGGFIQAIGPAVQAGAMPMDVVSDLLTAFARSFKLGRQAEDALERLGQQARQPQPESDNGAAAAAQAAQMEAQAKAAEMQMQQQAEAARMQMEGQKAQQDAALKAMDMQGRQQAEAAGLQLKQAEMQSRMEMDGRKLAIEEARLALEVRKLDIEERRVRGETVGRIVAATEDDDDPVVSGMRQMLQAPLAEPLAAIGEALAALSVQNQAILAAVRAPRRVQVERGADGMISGATQMPVEMMN